MCLAERKCKGYGAILPELGPLIRQGLTPPVLICSFYLGMGTANKARFVHRPAEIGVLKKGSVPVATPGFLLCSALGTPEGLCSRLAPTWAPKIARESSHF